MRYSDFVRSILTEQLHPDLLRVIREPKRISSTKAVLAKTIREISARGEKTGIEGNMPTGSSRAYLHIQEPKRIMLDGAPADIDTGMKIAIKSPNDKYHNSQNYDGHSLGELQNLAEHGDYYSRSRFHILTKNDDGTFTTNSEYGIFPPRLDYDHVGHQWAEVGHASSLTSKSFRENTKDQDFPNGIEHRDFVDVLRRSWDLNHGKYWKGSSETENRLDRVERHPLVQKFLDHQMSYASPPHDYEQMKNMGLFHHPDGSKYIVARDHGYNDQVRNAYREMFQRRY